MSPTEASAIELRQDGANGQARASALTAAAQIGVRPTSLVGYRSTGAIVIIGPADAAITAAERLQPALRCTVVVPEFVAGLPVPPNVTVLNERVIQVTGHLGQFAVIVAAPPPEGGTNLLKKLGSERMHFDLVLDLSTPAFVQDDLLPFGYHAPAGDAAALEQALAELPEMVGEFDKPRFFNYNPDICAHGANGITGCTRCLEACPAGAIISMHDEVAVDPYRCQGAGLCATVCPSGAMTYVYPSVADHLAKLSALLKAYRAAGGATPIILYHDAERGRERVKALAPNLPDYVIPMEIAELGSVGMDVWLAALAYGAAAVAMLSTPAIPKRALAEIDDQIVYTRAILEGMGYPAARLVARVDGDDQAVQAALADPPAALTTPAAFAVFDEKRTTLRLATEHLYAQAPAPQAEVPLPAGAPFGEILVNRDTCTLCMSCVGACPVGALADGGDLPQLQFIEGNCVQCGLCEKTCPEDAISLKPRYLYDPEARKATRVLYEEVPFHCIVCGKPFATQKMMATMTDKLKGHWMFQNDEALRRVKMCADCRVRDMFKAQYKKPQTT
jgi:ferredoxin